MWTITGVASCSEMATRMGCSPLISAAVRCTTLVVAGMTGLALDMSGITVKFTLSITVASVPATRAVIRIDSSLPPHEATARAAASARKKGRIEPGRFATIRCYRMRATGGSHEGRSGGGPGTTT